MIDIEKKLDKVFIRLLSIVIVACLYTFPVMWLWNWLMPLVFRLCKINVWQAWGLSALSNLLFTRINVNDKEK